MESFFLYSQLRLLSKWSIMTQQNLPPQLFFTTLPNIFSIQLLCCGFFACSPRSLCGTKNIILKRGMSTVKEETKTRITRYVQWLIVAPEWTKTDGCRWHDVNARRWLHALVSPDPATHLLFSPNARSSLPLETQNINIHHFGEKQTNKRKPCRSKRKFWVSTSALPNL